MNVNPFSYLIEKLKSKVSKSGDTMSGNLTVDKENGTTLSTAYSAVILGNNKPSGTDKNSFGVVRLYGENQAYTDLYAPNTTTQNRDITLPNKSGTVALTSDLDTVVKSVFQGVTSSSITIKNLQNGDMIIIGRNGLMMGIIVHDGLVNLLTPSALTDFSYSSGTLTFTRTSPYSSEIIVNYRNTVGRSTPTITG